MPSSPLLNSLKEKTDAAATSFWYKFGTGFTDGKLRKFKIFLRCKLQLSQELHQIMRSHLEYEIRVYNNINIIIYIIII